MPRLRATGFAQTEHGSLKSGSHLTSLLGMQPVAEIDGLTADAEFDAHAVVEMLARMGITITIH